MRHQLIKSGTVGASLLLSFLTPSLLANGGGYYYGGVENAGDIAGFEPVATENIRIVDESLTIGLGADEADVEVKYLMRNETDKEVTVRFGFPVEESFDNNEMSGDPDKRTPDGKTLTYSKNYSITAAGKPVEARWQGELREQEDKQFTGVAGWLISEITFAANEEIPVRIAFQSSYPVSSYSVSDDQSDEARLFRYRLSTAACWAGTIGSGRIEITPKGINPAHVKVIKPVNRFKKEADAWVWTFENLEPTLADDIEVEASPALRLYGGRASDGEFIYEQPAHLTVEYLEQRNEWSMRHSNYEVKASSALASEGEDTHLPENVRELWNEQVWTEGAEGPGAGEWLEITPAQAKPLLSILISPGDQRGENFAANPRPKKVLVELNEDHSFEADVPDGTREFTLPIRAYTKPVSKLRLTFTEVYPGTESQNLSVGSIRLHVKVSREPKIQPAR